MSDNNEIKLEPIIISMLTEMQAVFSKFGIDYFLVGAFARDIHFSSQQESLNFRRTNDVDLAVCINHEDRYNEVIDALVSTGLFIRDEKEIIKLYYKEAVEVDLIPFGEIEDDEREVKLTKPIAFTLQMPGFVEAAAFTKEILSGTLILKTCPIEGLIMLKLISWDDRPQRTHDVSDIDNIIDAYFDWNSKEIYSDHIEIMDLYDTDDTKFYLPKISSHVIGRKIKTMLAGSTELLERIKRILVKKSNPRWESILRGINEATEDPIQR